MTEEDNAFDSVVVYVEVFVSRFEELLLLVGGFLCEWCV